MHTKYFYTEQIFTDRARNDQVRYDRVRSDLVKHYWVRNDWVRNDSNSICKILNDCNMLQKILEVLYLSKVVEGYLMNCIEL